MTRLALAGALCATLTASAFAHPLGNNTVNREAGISLYADRLELVYRIDLAEIPTLLAAARADTDGDGSTSRDEWRLHAERLVAEATASLNLSVDGVAQKPAPRAVNWQLRPGELDLKILHIEARFAPLPLAADAQRLDYRDARETTRAGWKAVWLHASPPVRLLASDVPDASTSNGLLDYPENVIAPDVVTARAQFELPAPAPLPAPTAEARTLHEATVSAAPVQHPAQSAAAPDPEPTPAPEPAADPPPADLPPSAHAAPAAVAAAPDPATPSRSLWAFFKLGAHHIAIGWDHLLFLLGLVVAQRAWRRLIWVITAFTLAHSLTLALAASGLVTPPGALVEAAIAASIAWVGFANLMGWTRFNVWLALGFGLVHGFGFAGAMAENLGDLRAAGAGWVVDLAAFNLGIEAFQLLLVALTLPVLNWVCRQHWGARAPQLLSLSVLTAGLYWLFERLGFY